MAVDILHVHFTDWFAALTGHETTEEFKKISLSPHVILQLWKAEIWFESVGIKISLSTTFLNPHKVILLLAR